MRQFIAHLLILFVFATNVAWAMEDCSSQYSNEDYELMQFSGLPSDAMNGGVSDDPCVGCLHLVSIPLGTKFDYFPLTRQDVMRIESSFHSLDQAPPIRPPQI